MADHVIVLVDGKQVVRYQYEPDVPAPKRLGLYTNGTCDIESVRFGPLLLEPKPDPKPAPTYQTLALGNAATATTAKSMFTGAAHEVYVFPRWGMQTFLDIPFNVPDPKDGTVKNVIVLHGPLGRVSAKMPKEVQVACNAPAKAIHLLSGIAPWAFPFNREQTLSMTVRLRYADGTTEDHPLRNGIHFRDYADFSGTDEVPGSKQVLRIEHRQVRYLVLSPKKPGVPIRTIDFIKGEDNTAPVVMAVTIEKR